MQFRADVTKFCLSVFLFVLVELTFIFVTTEIVSLTRVLDFLDYPQKFLESEMFLNFSKPQICLPKFVTWSNFVWMYPQGKNQ
jgi:hypothetical protein